MDYFNVFNDYFNVLITFLRLERGSAVAMQGQKALEFAITIKHKLA